MNVFICVCAYIFVYMCVCVCIYIYMLPYPCRVELSSEGSKCVAISVMQGSSYESSSR